MGRGGENAYCSDISTRKTWDVTNQKMRGKFSCGIAFCRRHLQERRGKRCLGVQHRPLGQSGDCSCQSDHGLGCIALLTESGFGLFVSPADLAGGGAVVL